MTPDQASQAVKKAFDLIEPMLKEHGLEAILITAVPNKTIGICTTPLTHEDAMGMMHQAWHNINDQFSQAIEQVENN